MAVVKRLLAVWLLCLLLIPVAACAQQAVVDQAALFTSEEQAKMTALIGEMQSGWQIDGVILTSRLSAMSDAALQDVADRYYEDNGYGLGEDRAGFLLLIDMGNRYLHISTAGVMIDYLDDDRIEELLDILYDGASQGSYGAAVLAMLRQTLEYLQDGIREGQFRFDAETGQRLSGLYNKLTRGEGIFAGVMGVLAATAVAGIVAARYQLVGGTYHYDVKKNTTLSLDRDEVIFLYQSSHRTRVSSGSGGGGGGGSSVHSSSGGMSHGGGGRHF